MLTLTENNLKNVAKQLKQLSSENGCDIKHTAILEAISKGLGYKNYNTLKATLENAQPIEIGSLSTTLSQISSMFSKPFEKSARHEVYKDKFSKALTTLVTEGIGLNEAQNIIQWCFDEVMYPGAIHANNNLYSPVEWETTNAESKIVLNIMKNTIQEVFDELARKRSAECDKTSLSEWWIANFYAKEIRVRDAFNDYAKTSNGQIHFCELILTGKFCDEKLLAIFDYTEDEYLAGLKRVRERFSIV